MIEIPASIRDLYPQPLNRVPHRPWWEYKVNYKSNLAFVRPDGANVEITLSSYYGKIPDIGAWWERNVSGMRERDISREPYTAEMHAILGMVEYDVQLPLRRPGYRYGQVWISLVQPSMPILAITDANSISDCQMVGYVDVRKNYHETPVYDLLSRAILIADPACPHLAPWAPQAIQAA